MRVDFPRQVDEEFEHAVEATVRERGAVREDLVAVPAAAELGQDIEVVAGICSYELLGAS